MLPDRYLSEHPRQRFLSHKAQGIWFDMFQFLFCERRGVLPPDFDGHAGLQLLYAERLARREKPGWFPTGAGIEAVELVWHDLGRDTSVLPLAQRVADALAENKS